MIDRDIFFNTVRSSLFGGNLVQSQVDGMNYLLGIWETFFEKPNPNDGNKWLAYCMATVYHETGKKMVPVPENGGKAYGNPPAKYWSKTGPYNQAYYGRGHVQLTWDTNYQKGQDQLKKNYKLDVPIYAKPDLMLHDQPSALILYDGMTIGWFTGVGLSKYISAAQNIEDSYNARRTVNGTDQASTIQGYYNQFKPAIVTTSTPAPKPPKPTPEPPVAEIPTVTITMNSDSPVNLIISGGENVTITDISNV